MGVRIRFIGRRDWRVPRRVLRRMDEAMRADRAQPGDDLHRRLQLRRPGRAGRRRAERWSPRASRRRRIDEKAITGRLYAPDMPDPDLVIRTSGEFRISNFLIWELAYSELVFTDVLWPDFRREHLVEAIREYQRRDRRFGGARPSDVGDL